FSCFLLTSPPPPPSTLFPYTTLFRSFIDADQSTVYYTPNITWRNEPLRERLRAELDLDITIDNDANAAGWAEFQFGAGRHVRDIDRKSTRLNSSHVKISYAVFCLKKK